MGVTDTHPADGREQEAPGPVEPEHPPGAADGETRDRPDPLRRKIAVTLAAVVVLAAGLAILRTDADVDEANTARETTRLAVRAMRANVGAATLAGAAAEIQAESAFLPFRRPLTVGVPSLEAAAAGAAPSGQAEQAAAAAQAAMPVDATAPLLDQRRFEAARAGLAQRALATTRISWNDRSTAYTTVIAVLAAALFLIGFGLIVEASIRPYSYALGLVIAVFAAGWAIWLYEQPTPTTPAAAIDAAAHGTVLTAAARFPEAVAAYDASIAADGDYAAAYVGRAQARLLAANPDYRVTGAFTDTAGTASAAGAADAQRGLDLGGERDLLGFSLVALDAFYAGHYQATLDAVDPAEAINARAPELALLRSAAELGLGDEAAAADFLARAHALLQGSEPSRRTRQLAASYLSYLASVEHRDPSRAPGVRRLSDQAVGAETTSTLGPQPVTAPPTSGAVAVEGLAFADGRLTLTLRWSDLRSGTSLSAIAYERPLVDGAWTQPTELAIFMHATANGVRRISVPLERACQPTAVRVDVYLNGAPASSAEGPGVAQTC
jgi:hypothetical protein